MKILPQAIVYLSSLMIFLILGSLFDIAFLQAGIHFRHLHGEMPLPNITRFFVENHNLPVHLVLLPWLGFVGGPLLSFSATKDYWDTSFFIMRFLAFFTCELLFILILLFALLLPFIPYYGVLEPFRQSPTELAIRVIFWCGIAIISILGIRRILLKRNGTGSPDDGLNRENAVSHRDVR